MAAKNAITAGTSRKAPGSGMGEVSAVMLSIARKRSEFSRIESKVPEKFATPSPLKKPEGSVVPKLLPPTGVPPQKANNDRVPSDPATEKSSEIAVRGEEKEIVSGPESLYDPQKF